MAIGPDGTVWAASGRDLLRFNEFELTAVAEIPSAPFGGRSGFLADSLWPTDANRALLVFHVDGIRYAAEYDTMGESWVTWGFSPSVQSVFDDGFGLVGAGSDDSVWKITEIGLTPLVDADPWQNYLFSGNTADGALYNYLDGFSSTATDAGAPVDGPIQVEGTTSQNVWVIGGNRAARFDGSEWTPYDLDKPPVRLTVSDGIVAVLHDDQTISIFEDGSWQNVALPIGVPELRDIESALGLVWVLAQDGQVWQYQP